MKLKPGLYLGDNGRCFCDAHAGMTAKATGRDLSGQKVHRLTDADLAYMRTELKTELVCESCKQAA